MRDQTLNPSRERPLKISAVFELILAGGLWGFGFIASMWALTDLGPLGVTGLRFVFACVAGLAICVVLPGLRRQLSWSQFKMAFWPGVFLFSTLILQTWGLRFTTATKSSFITCLYVLIVPVMERVLLGRRIPRYHFVFVVLALIGVGLICDVPQMFMAPTVGGTGVNPRELWNLGDWLTLACAVFASLQIVWFGRIQDKIESSFNFNIYQCIWAAPVPIALAFAMEPVTLRLSGLAWGGLGMLVFGSTLIAFGLQVRAQKSISPSLASLLFLLESPFAAFFGILLLNERLTFTNAVGCSIILFALGASVLFAQAEDVPVASL